MENSNEIDDRQDESEQVWNDFANIWADPPHKRHICQQCQRPESVCFCLDIEPLVELRNHLIILQHPNELKRCLRTTKILELSIPPSNYHLFNGKRFTQRKFAALHELIKERQTILVYPSGDAQPLDNHIEQCHISMANGCNVIMLDGTWSQARVLYNTNAFLHSLPCVILESTGPSQYVIRTQPTDNCLSTVEAAALILSRIEANMSIYDRLTKPLRTICNFQLGKGAVEHQSKQFLISNGLYNKPLNKKVMRKMAINSTNSNSLQDLKDLVHLFDR